MNDFDKEEAKKFLLSQEKLEKEQLETERTSVLDQVTFILKEHFKDSGVEVYLVGSLIRPFAFTKQSDVDIVLKNFHGDRFDLWTKLEDKIKRQIEIIPFEKCHFQDFVQKEGLKIV